MPLLSIALLVLAAGFGAAIDWLWVVVVACLLVCVALLQAARAATELERRRRTADEWLLFGTVARLSSSSLDWRAGELTSPRTRSTPARSLRRIEREAGGEAPPGPVPLNKPAIRSHLGLVCVLRKRLDDRARPVSARGMVLVDRLLTEPGSPLYSRLPDEVLAEALSDALAALDPGDPAVAA